MLKACKEANAQAAKEKRDQDAAQTKNMVFQGQYEVAHTSNDDFMTENPATQQSMLAKHRVIPYHFKGFNEQQKAEVMNEREMQLREKEMLARSEKE